jgi:GT2 family glycosyltransferase
VTESPFRAEDVSVAIPTYERGEVLVATLRALIAQRPGEILVLDQTNSHPADVEAALMDFERQGQIQWEHLARPAIPPAMNAGLLRSTRPIVLYVDDDILPAPDLVSAHAAAYSSDTTWAVAGQVLQPGEVPTSARAWRTDGFGAYLDFSFCYSKTTFIENGISCNLSMRRQQALAVGGFDENFEGAAYRYETEFCRRLCRGGGRILFEPRASVHHLRAPRGGTRSGGGHMTSASGAHGVGDYYFALLEHGGPAAWAYLARRPWREVATRFHLRHPWWIPVKLIGEMRGFLRALQLAAHGPRRLSGTDRISVPRSAEEHETVVARKP